jgi:hypothetical protein
MRGLPLSTVFHAVGKSFPLRTSSVHSCATSYDRHLVTAIQRAVAGIDLDQCKRNFAGRKIILITSLCEKSRGGQSCAALADSPLGRAFAGSELNDGKVFLHDITGSRETDEGVLTLGRNCCGNRGAARHQSPLGRFLSCSNKRYR